MITSFASISNMNLNFEEENCLNKCYTIHKVVGRIGITKLLVFEKRIINSLVLKGYLIKDETEAWYTLSNKALLLLEE